MLRTFRTKVLAVLCLGLLAAACQPAAPAATTAPTLAPTATAPAATTAPTVAPTGTASAATAIKLTDSLGREVTLPTPAKRIVSLAPSNTEILFSIGAGATLVGRDDYSDYPAEALAVASVGSLYPTVNAEGIVALQPDLVLAAGITNPDDVKHLAELGLTVYATSITTGLEDVYNDIRAVGTLTGHSQAADALIADFQTRAAAVTAKTKDVAERPLVFYEVDATEPSKPWTAGPGSFIDQLITMAGGKNAGNILDDKYAQLSLEQLVAEDPDIIVLGSATFGGQTPELVAARPGWGGLKAVKNGAVYTFDDNLISRPGPRTIDGLEKLAQLIHPELYK